MSHAKLCGIKTMLKCPHVTLHYFFRIWQAVAKPHYAKYRNVTLQAHRKVLSISPLMGIFLLCRSTPSQPALNVSLASPLGVLVFFTFMSLTVQ